MGRNEDLVRIDSIKILNKTYKEDEVYLNRSAYVNKKKNPELYGINYRLNTIYKIEDDLRKWEKVDVLYIEKHSECTISDALIDEDNDLILFYK